jgi:serine phosphatase RsbU (regulator of sigma subunit)
LKKFNRYIKIFVLLFLIAENNLLAVPDSLVFKVKGTGNKLDFNFNGTALKVSQTYQNSNCWLYNNKDDFRFALKDFDDSKWKVKESDFEIKESDTSFKGLCWMRMHYKVSSFWIGKPFMLRMSHFGASEIFNDNKFVTSFGIVSADPQQEVAYDPGIEFFPLIVSDTLEHVISVRYSNANFLKYYDKFGEDEVGFTLRFLTYEDIEQVQMLSEYEHLFFLGIALFLFALALVHLMIYLFERSRKFNLYHSFFVGALALSFLQPVLHSLIETPLASFRLTYFADSLKPIFFISALTLLYNLFQKKLNKFYYICFSVFVLALFFRYIINDYYNFFYVSLFFMMYFGCTSMSIKAIRRNFRGAKIVGFGVLGTTIFMLLVIVTAIFMAVTQFDGLILLMAFVILGILSLPLSMSVYLAFDFAGANKTLKNQIVQIEDLSAKAIKDAEEKKQILENQNQMLEAQVKVRTAEIVEQKEIIEEKNKDITDSIYYAKRIQDATLASKEIKYKLFPNAFVLFKPKDIVSGDFYWFAGKNGKRLISVCDCTGHGVPGALMSMIGNNLLNKVVNEKAITSPDKILIELDEELRLTLKKEENTDSKDGMDVALLTFINEREMEYAGANRPLWIVRGGVLEEIKATKISIGGDRYGNEQQFKCHSIKLQEGDTVYISSDGFADQFNNNDKKLMTRRFKEILIGIQHLSMPEQEKYLDDFIEKWKGNLEQTDDILVIGIRV